MKIYQDVHVQVSARYILVGYLNVILGHRLKIRVQQVRQVIHLLKLVIYTINKLMNIIWESWMISFINGWNIMTSHDDPYALKGAVNYEIDNQWEESGWQATWSSSHSFIHSYIYIYICSSWLSITTNKLVDIIVTWDGNCWMISHIHGRNIVMSFDNHLALGEVVSNGLDNQQKNSGWRAARTTSNPPTHLWLVINHKQPTHGYAMAIVDDILHSWMKHCDAL